MKAPELNELEMSVFGPGYGECIVLHVGSGQWVIIDSCLDDRGEPVSISYLRSLGVAVEDAVRCVSASHWHDDHIRGLGRVVAACPSARFALSAAFQKGEFLQFLQAYEDQPDRLDKGGTELLRCLRQAREHGSRVRPLSEDKVVIDFPASALAHGKPVELRALSPSDGQFADFLRRIGKFAQEKERQPKTRIAEPSKNDLSVAMLLTIGDQAVLLGADLENSSDSSKGWQAVVNGRKGRGPLAHLYKVPHHGSQGAHNDEVWREMLAQRTWAVVTPWRRGGRSLPTDADKRRLSALAHRSYLTSSELRRVKRRYPRDLTKHVAAFNIGFDSAIYTGGRVTLRWTPPATEPEESLANGAVVI